LKNNREMICLTAYIVRVFMKELSYETHLRNRFLDKLLVNWKIAFSQTFKQQSKILSE
jgi:hypothetical protein